MKRIYPLPVGLLLGALVALVGWNSTGPSTSSALDGITEQGKVELCHLTGSETNPVVRISVAEAAVPAHYAHGDWIANPYHPCPTP